MLLIVKKTYLLETENYIHYVNRIAHLFSRHLSEFPFASEVSSVRFLLFLSDKPKRNLWVDGNRTSTKSLEQA